MLALQLGISTGSMLLDALYAMNELIKSESGLLCLYACDSCHYTSNVVVERKSAEDHG